MGQSLLFDTRVMYLCERSVCYEVLNGDDFDTDGQASILSSGKGMTSKEDFIKAVGINFGINEKQIVWFKPEEIPRVEGICCECKKTKSFQKFESEHFKEITICHRCLLGKYTKGFFEKHFDKGHQKEFMEEIEREESQ